MPESERGMGALHYLVLPQQRGRAEGTLRKESKGKNTSVLTIKNGQTWANQQTTAAFARAIETNEMRRRG